jgi:hypothetical protein
MDPEFDKLFDDAPTPEEFESLFNDAPEAPRPQSRVIQMEPTEIQGRLPEPSMWDRVKKGAEVAFTGPAHQDHPLNRFVPTDENAAAGAVGAADTLAFGMSDEIQGAGAALGRFGENISANLYNPNELETPALNQGTRQAAQATQQQLEQDVTATRASHPTATTVGSAAGALATAPLTMAGGSARAGVALLRAAKEARQAGNVMRALQLEAQAGTMGLRAGAISGAESATMSAVDSAGHGGSAGDIATSGAIGLAGGAAPDMIAVPAGQIARAAGRRLQPMADRARVAAGGLVPSEWKDKLAETAETVRGIMPGVHSLNSYADAADRAAARAGQTMEGVKNTIKGRRNAFQEAQARPPQPAPFRPAGLLTPPPREMPGPAAPNPPQSAPNPPQSRETPAWVDTSPASPPLALRGREGGTDIVELPGGQGKEAVGLSRVPSDPDVIDAEWEDIPTPGQPARLGPGPRGPRALPDIASYADPQEVRRHRRGVMAFDDAVEQGRRPQARDGGRFIRKGQLENNRERLFRHDRSEANRYEGAVRRRAQDAEANQRMAYQPEVDPLVTPAPRSGVVTPSPNSYPQLPAQGSNGTLVTPAPRPPRALPANAGEGGVDEFGERWGDGLPESPDALRPESELGYEDDISRRELIDTFRHSLHRDPETVALRTRAEQARKAAERKARIQDAIGTSPGVPGAVRGLDGDPANPPPPLSATLAEPANARAADAAQRAMPDAPLPGSRRAAFPRTPPGPRRDPLITELPEEPFELNNPRHEPFELQGGFMPFPPDRRPPRPRFDFEAPEDPFGRAFADQVRDADPADVTMLPAPERPRVGPAPVPPPLPPRAPAPPPRTPGMVDIQPFANKAEGFSNEYSRLGSLGEAPANRFGNMARSFRAQHGSQGMPFEEAHLARQELDDKNIWGQFPTSAQSTRTQALRGQLDQQMQVTADAEGVGREWKDANRVFGPAVEGAHGARQMSERGGGFPYAGFIGGATVGALGGYSASDGNPLGAGLGGIGAAIAGAGVATGARNLGRTYGPSMKASLLETASRRLQQYPEQFGRFAQPLLRARARGAAHFAATWYTLHRDPEFRAIIGGTTPPNGEEVEE